MATSSSSKRARNADHRTNQTARLSANLKRLGFTGPYSGGKHDYMQRGSARVRIPNPHHSDISKELLKDLLDQAGVTRAEGEALP